MFLSHKLKIRLSVALAFLVSVLVGAGLTAMPAAHATLNVTLNPTSGPPATTVHIYASGFTPNGEIATKLWNGTSSGTFTADNSGDVNTTVIVPDVETGLYGFTITDTTTGSQTQTQFTVTSTASTPTPTPKVPEFPSLLIVLPLLIALSIAAVPMARKAKQATL